MIKFTESELLLNNFPINLFALDSLSEILVNLKVFEFLDSLDNSNEALQDRLKQLNNLKNQYYENKQLPDILNNYTKYDELKCINKNLKTINKNNLQWYYKEYYDFVKSAFIAQMTTLKKFKENKINQKPDKKLISNLSAINALSEILSDIIRSPFGNHENTNEMRLIRLEFLEKAKNIYIENNNKADDENDLQKMQNLKIAEELLRKMNPTKISYNFREYYDFAKKAIEIEKQRISGN